MMQSAELTKCSLSTLLLQALTPQMLNATACLDWLLQAIHAGWVVCPHCNQEIQSDRQRKAFRSLGRVCCKSCGRWFDSRTGTVLAGTTLSPREIILLALLLEVRIPVGEIAERLGLHETTVRDWRDRISTGGRFCAADNVEGNARGGGGGGVPLTLKTREELS